jgi:cell division transport system permease protein
MISDIVYDKQLVNLVNDNIVSMWILIISGFLAFIAVLLINSSLRLSIHQSIYHKTMQMVGATKSFIRKPFVMQYKTGHARCWFSNYCIDWCVLYVETSFPDLGILDNKILIAAVLLAVLGIGILITWLSTHFATQKFLNLRTDDLY